MNRSRSEAFTDLWVKPLLDLAENFPSPEVRLEAMMAAAHFPLGRVAWQKMIGPGWGGLIDSQVKLADGSAVSADRAYLAESIRQPDARVVEGYPAGVMPAYSSILSDAEVDAMVAYLASLNTGEKH